MIADRDLFLTLDKSEIVAADDPRANFLLARVGDELEAETVTRYGLAPADPDDDGKAEGGEEGVKKAFSSPPEVKRQKGKR